MKKFNIIIAVVMITMVCVCFLNRCKEQNQNTITGKVIAYEYCTSSVKGYLIEVQEPVGIGENIVLSGTQYSNVVKTYSQPMTTLDIGDQITGTYQMMPDSTNCRVCTAQYPIYNVPEIVLSFND